MANKPDYDEMTDERLMACVQNCEHGAFAVLVRRHSKMFFAAAYRMCSNADEAEDIVQDAFLKLWKNPKGWDAAHGVKFTTWFYRVVTNQALDAMRKKKPQVSADVIEFVADERDSQQDVLEEREEQQALEGAIKALPERQKAALNLCYYEGLSNKEAADVLGVGVKALESLLMRAKAAIREALNEKGFLTEATRKEAHNYGRA